MEGWWRAICDFMGHRLPPITGETVVIYPSLAECCRSTCMGDKAQRSLQSSTVQAVLFPKGEPSFPGRKHTVVSLRNCFQG